MNDLFNGVAKDWMHGRFINANANARVAVESFAIFIVKSFVRCDVMFLDLPQDGKQQNRNESESEAKRESSYFTPRPTILFFSFFHRTNTKERKPQAT